MGGHKGSATSLTGKESAMNKDISYSKSGRMSPNSKTKKESEAMAELYRIVAECKEQKGKSSGELSEQMENLKIEIGIETLKRKFQQLKTIQTADKLHMMSENFPKILKTIYQEDKIRMKEQSEDEMAVLKAFEMRKVDTKYF